MGNDELLDNALKSYTAGEPPANFASRVLELARLGRIRWLWAGVPVAAAAAACAWWVLSVEPPKAYRIEPSAIVRDEPAVLPTRKIYHAPKRNLYRVRTNRGMSSQERALLRFAINSPDAAADWIMRIERADTPLEIKKIEIQPLETEEQKK